MCGASWCGAAYRDDLPVQPRAAASTTTVHQPRPPIMKTASPLHEGIFTTLFNSTGQGCPCRKPLLMAHSSPLGAALREGAHEPLRVGFFQNRPDSPGDGRRKGRESGGVVTDTRHPCSAWLLRDDGRIPANDGQRTVHRRLARSTVAPEADRKSTRLKLQ